MKIQTLALALLTLIVSSCCISNDFYKEPLLSTYGKLSDGQEVQKITLVNKQGMTVELSSLGAGIVSVKTADKDGQFADVALGYDNVPAWEKHGTYKGVTVGRYANRIAKGQFSLDGKDYSLVTNNGPNHLHGGTKGFNAYVWATKTFTNDSESGVIFTRTSPDGEEGYPGTVEATVIYTLTDDNELKIEMKATTDKSTLINLCNHAYWNLSGDGGQSSIEDHQLKIHADYFLPVDETAIPTGELRAVKGTPFDFSAVKTIADDIAQENTQLKYGKGYDHCYVVNGQQNKLRPVAILIDPKSGRQMELISNQPGVQLYTGNWLDGSGPGKGAVNYKDRAGVALETQNFPDAPNQLKFPSPVLYPNQEYYHVVIHKFSVKK